ncbi:unnamed protein product [Albugo candida]|uniref:Uncharacterized protein n=1 Tax=Albugo candida TaxID=65357 RepID=A0A024GLX1_9STRA|nr:unnamed protein product [Albugo candida]|eukprot:CCI47505.1 unnamed protein product [Albugo candida]
MPINPVEARLPEWFDVASRRQQSCTRTCMQPERIFRSRSKWSMLLHLSRVDYIRIMMLTSPCLHAQIVATILARYSFYYNNRKNLVRLIRKDADLIHFPKIQPSSCVIRRAHYKKKKVQAHKLCIKVRMFVLKLEDPPVDSLYSNHQGKPMPNNTTKVFCSFDSYQY